MSNIACSKIHKPKQGHQEDGTNIYENKETKRQNCGNRKDKGQRDCVRVNSCEWNSSLQQGAGLSKRFRSVRNVLAVDFVMCHHSGVVQEIPFPDRRKAVATLMDWRVEMCPNKAKNVAATSPVKVDTQFFKLRG